MNSMVGNALTSLSSSKSSFPFKGTLKSTLNKTLLSFKFIELTEFSIWLIFLELFYKSLQPFHW